MPPKKNYLWLLIVIAIIGLLSLGLLLYISSPQVNQKTKRYVAQTLQQLPFIPDRELNQAGQEKIIPVEIVNEHPTMSISESDVSFDFLTERFKDYFASSQLEKLVIHLTDQEQFMVENEIIGGESLPIAGFGGEELNKQAHVYIFANPQNLLKSGKSDDDIARKLEWNLVAGLVLLRYLTDHYQYPQEKMFKETFVEWELINYSKDNQPLLIVDLQP